MSREDELRDALRRLTADVTPDPEAQERLVRRLRTTRRRRGRARRPPAGPLRWPALVGAPLAALGVVAGLALVVLNGRGVGTGHTTGPGDALAAPSGTAPRAAHGSPAVTLTGFRAADLTFISATSGWALGTLPCATTRCAAVLRTLDGGATWTTLAQPRVSVTAGGCAAAQCVSGIRFADPQHGYLFGTTTLVSSDGGLTWGSPPDPEALGTVVDAIEPAGDDVLRVTHTGQAPLPGYAVSRQVAGSSSWQPVALPLDQGAPLQGWSAQLERAGHDAYLMLYGNLSRHSRGTLLVSHDDGVTWTVQDDPCAPTPAATAAGDGMVSFAAAPGGALTVVCATPGGHDLRVSADGGALATVVDGPAGTLGAVTVLDARDLLVTVRARAGDARSSLYASHDAGLSWNRVATESGSTPQGFPVTYLGAQNPTTARWVDTDGTGVWTTIDGGTTWSRHTF